MIHSPADRRSSFGQKVNRTARELGVDPLTQEREISPCKVLEVRGPQNAVEGSRLKEDFHFWVLLELPSGYRLKQTLVRLGHTAHEIYSLYGNPASLTGMFCKVRYKHSIADTTHGRALLMPDYGAEYPDTEITTRSYTIAPFSGVFTDDAGLLIDSLGQDPEGEGSLV